jgi:hypothetical protein
LRVDRVAFYNPNLAPTSKVMYPDPARKGAKINWYNYNLRTNSSALSAYLAAVAAHEGWGQGGSQANPTASGHTGAWALAIKANRPDSDPVQWLEGQFGPAASDLTTRLDRDLRKLEGTLTVAGDDPRPEIWHGQIALWDRQLKRWNTCTLSVGGSEFLDCPL